MPGSQSAFPGKFYTITRYTAGVRCEAQLITVVELQCHLSLTNSLDILKEIASKNFLSVRKKIIINLLVSI